MGIFSSNSDRKLLEARMKEAGRLPPGQVATLKWPVLHLGAVPHFDPQTWELRTTGFVRNPLRLTWDQFQALPRTEVTADFHCVTRWSRFDNRWEGVSFRSLCDFTQPLSGATHVLIHGEEEYTTNAPLADLLEDNVLLADRHDGAPLEPEHGGPLRLVVPKLYGWKSAKWFGSLNSWRATSRATGSATAITCMAIRGANSGSTAIDTRPANVARRWTDERMGAQTFAPP